MLFTPYAHAMGFPAYFSTPTPSFRSATYRLVSGVGFSACFFSSYAHAMGFYAYFFYSHAQFPLRNISISFRGGLFCSLFRFLAHAMGFHAYFSAPTPSFRSATVQLTSGMGFPACFSLPTPTPWVSPPTFLLPRPVSAPGLYN